ncbi:MAG: glutathione S-transferase family protein [Rhodobacteraceae bacterium]|nr:glutathione S-transferase family protein [Paracoccaceae bacterium]
MYTLYGALTTRAFRAAWLLEELGQDYTVVSAYPHSAEIKAVNPRGKVPILVDDDLVITDSTAILTYLTDKHAAFTAAPGTADRARQDAMLHRILDELEGPIWGASKHSFIFPEKLRVPEVATTMGKEFAHNLNGFSDALAGDCLMGDEMTVPDILLVHLMTWALFMKIPVENQTLLAYSKRLRSRPAYAKVSAQMKAAAAG